MPLTASKSPLRRGCPSRLRQGLSRTPQRNHLKGRANPLTRNNNSLMRSVRGRDGGTEDRYSKDIASPRFQIEGRISFPLCGFSFQDKWLVAAYGFHFRTAHHRPLTIEPLNARIRPSSPFEGIERLGSTTSRYTLLYVSKQEYSTVLRTPRYTVL